jgi:hypothetical protein
MIDAFGTRPSVFSPQRSLLFTGAEVDRVRAMTLTFLVDL